MSGLTLTMNEARLRIEIVRFEFEIEKIRRKEQSYEGIMLENDFE